MLPAMSDKAVAEKKKAGVLKKIERMLRRKKKPRVYVTDKPNRSWSDNGLYTQAVARAYSDDAVFAGFKRDPHYCEILEHVTPEQGAIYLEIVEKESPDLLSLIERFKINDRIGNPVLCDFGKIGMISPSTLRYVKVLSDLRNFFGDLSAARIAEIGVGYGGQVLVIDQLWKTKSYTMFDLDPVLKLVTRYLESHILQTAYCPTTYNRFEPGQEFDLVISNFAFSELPRHLQMGYVEKVLKKSKRGYLTMNSGVGDHTDNGRFLSSAELAQMLPGVEIYPEVSNGKDWASNYILVWGVKK